MPNKELVLESFAAIVQAVREQNIDGSFRLTPDSSLTAEEVLQLLLEGDGTIYLHLRSYFGARNNFEIIERLETFYHYRKLLSVASKEAIMEHAF